MQVARAVLEGGGVTSEVEILLKKFSCFWKEIFCFLEGGLKEVIRLQKVEKLVRT